MIYLLETYTGLRVVKQCLIHCQLSKQPQLFKWCQKTFTYFHLTAFAEYAFDGETVPFYDENKNQKNMVDEYILPRPVSFEDMRNWGCASIENLK
jgi:hypothetical protein